MLSTGRGGGNMTGWSCTPTRFMARGIPKQMYFTPGAPPAEVRRTCAYRANVLTLSTKIGESVKKCLIDHLDSADKTKILGTLQEIAAIKANTSSEE